MKFSVANENRKEEEMVEFWLEESVNNTIVLRAKNENCPGGWIILRISKDGLTRLGGIFEKNLGINIIDGKIALCE